MKINLLLIAILLAFTSSAQQRLSVIQAQELGLLNNIKVKNAKLDLSLAKKKYWKLLLLACQRLMAK